MKPDSPLSSNNEPTAQPTSGAPAAAPAPAAGPMNQPGQSAGTKQPSHSRLVVIIVLVAVVTGVVVFAALYMLGQRSDNPSSGTAKITGSSQSSPGEAKAQSFVNALHSDDSEQALEELLKGAGITGGLKSSDPRAFTYGVRVGLLSGLLKKSAAEKYSSKSTTDTSGKPTVMVYYKVKLLKAGTTSYFVVTVRQDNDTWVISDLTVHDTDPLQ